MNRNTQKLFFALLRSVICNKMLQEQEKELFSEELLPELIETAKQHDISHLIAYAMEQNSLINKEEDKKISKEVIIAIYRYEQQSRELARLCKLFEEAEIPFMPLKGSVLRKFYNEPWMRTSCDIDILVHEENVERAAELMVKTCGYIREGKNSHDISLYSGNNTHIELHYNLIEERVLGACTRILNEIWNEAFVREGYKYWYEMSDAMFYFYHIAHISKHFVNGGCGIKPFIDLWILDRINDADKEKRDILLEKGGLLKFKNSVCKLSRVWLDDEEIDAISQQIQDYILSGGAYGTTENYIVVQQQRKGGRLKYALSKIFIPYDIIKFHYPILNKHRWLTPFMEVRRWCRLAFCGQAKRTLNELKYSNNISDAKALNIQEFLNNIGL